MRRDVARHQRGAHPRGLERRDLLVKRADHGPLFVAQHRRVDRARNMIVGEFERRTHIDDFIEIIPLVECGEQVFQGGGAKRGKGNSLMPVRACAPAPMRPPAPQ
ncbi:hypothetical protein D9M68_814160 [compost metagenome]